MILVVNYDLPWNPQRIEQRIGRCHRYGQKFDVVVVNFLNKHNAADQRVYQLLDEKFRLFDGVFGASDEVLGAVESGVDFEKRIAAIYQQCRTPEQIQFEFDQLQRELETEIAAGQRGVAHRFLQKRPQDPDGAPLEQKTRSKRAHGVEERCAAVSRGSPSGYTRSFLGDTPPHGASYTRSELRSHRIRLCIR